VASRALIRYQVRLTVPRRSGMRAWGRARDEFEARLAGQVSDTVIAAEIECEFRRGRDYVRVAVAVTVDAPDVAEALDTAWWIFRKAASADAEGWDMAAAVAGVKPA
jgi:hypothetical protein